jgi:hypothetical protein
MKTRAWIYVVGAFALLGCSADDSALQSAAGGAGGMSTGGNDSGSTDAGGTATTGGGAAVAGSDSTGTGGGSESGGSAGGTPTGTACRVGDTVYAHGALGIDDPFSCNTCSCEDGKLVCTEQDCPIDCPEGTVADQWSCDECGPGGTCLVTFWGCLPRCSASMTCPEAMPSCFRGACRRACQ